MSALDRLRQARRLVNVVIRQLVEWTIVVRVQSGGFGANPQEDLPLLLLRINVECEARMLIDDNPLTQPLFFDQRGVLLVEDVEECVGVPVKDEEESEIGLIMQPEQDTL